MIDTAMTVLAKGAVEHAKDTVESVAERVKEAELPPLTRRARKRNANRARWLLFALGAFGLVTVAMVMMRRRRPAFDEVAPDPFGKALAEERAAGKHGRKPIATPGA